MKTRNDRARWVPLLILAGIVAACQQVTPTADAPAPTPAPTPAQQASCYDSAITLLDRGGADIHGAIVADTLHMGGATAPATCSAPVNQSLAGLPDDRAAQALQSRYYLIVIRYPGGNRLYVLSLRADGTSCVVDTDDECIARVTDLPDDFDLEELPDDVAPIIPAGRPAPPTAGPSPGDDETPPTAGPAPGDDTPPAPGPSPGDDETPPTAGPAPGDDTPPAPGPSPGDDETPPSVAGTPPGAASSPQPSDAATGVTVDGPLLSWAAAPRASSYDVYWAAENTDLDTPINTTLTTLRIAASADLDADTLYYWRVDAKNEAGATRGAVWSFTTAPAPAPEPAPPAEETEPTSAVSNPQPSDGATGVTVRPYGGEPQTDDGVRLSWSASATATISYDLYWGVTRQAVAAAQRFDRSGWGVRDDYGYVARSVLDGTAWTIWRHSALDEDGLPVGNTVEEFYRPLAGNTTYYWRVDAVHSVEVNNVGRLGGATTTKGPVWSFTTGEGPGAECPVRWCQ